MKKLLHTLLFLLLALPVAGMVIAAAEQGTGSDSAETARAARETTLADEAQDLLATIDERFAQSQQIKSKQKGATGEELALAIVEVMRVEDELREALDKLLANVKKQQAAGVDVS